MKRKDRLRCSRDIFGIGVVVLTLLVEFFTLFPLALSSLKMPQSAYLNRAIAIAYICFLGIYVLVLVLHYFIYLLSSENDNIFMPLLLILLSYSFLDLFILFRLDVITYSIVKSLTLILFIIKAKDCIVDIKTMLLNAEERLNGVHSNKIIIPILIAVVFAILIYTRYGLYLNYVRYKNSTEIELLYLNMGFALEIVILTLVSIASLRKTLALFFNSYFIIIAFAVLLNCFINIQNKVVIAVMMSLFLVICMSTIACDHKNIQDKRKHEKKGICNNYSSV